MRILPQQNPPTSALRKKKNLRFLSPAVHRRELAANGEEEIPETPPRKTTPLLAAPRLPPRNPGHLRDDPTEIERRLARSPVVALRPHPLLRRRRRFPGLRRLVGPLTRDVVGPHPLPRRRARPLNPLHPFVKGVAPTRDHRLALLRPSPGCHQLQPLATSVPASL